MKREVVCEMIRDCADIFGRELTSAMIDWYDQELQDISVDRLRRALGSWMRTSKFFPYPSEIREANSKLPRTAEEEERARQKLLTRIDWNPKQLASYRDSPEELLKLAAPSEEQAAQLVKEALEQRPLRQLSGDELAARIAELEQQRRVLLSQAHVTELRVETERAVTRAVKDGADA